ncbi:glycosyltransferase [Vibrio cholerae]|nr:glycosyltransferase [Vibrio cholerae]
MRILHVTDCYAGGVSRAVNDIAIATKSEEHFLMWRGTDTPDDAFSDQAPLPRNPLARPLGIRGYANALQADVIFAHSSLAGFYSRVLKSDVPIIYQPHCFAFHDVNKKAMVRQIYFLVERALSQRTATFITLNEQEYKAATLFRSPALVREASNVPHIKFDDRSSADEAVAVDAKKIVMVGRLTKQKNPLYFLEVARLVRQTDEDYEFVWVGDGDERYRNLLERSGITVTGWVDQTTLKRNLSSAWLYLHTADYEGFPISILDAAVMGLPIIVRDIPCFEGSGLHAVSNSHEAKEFILALANDESASRDLAKRSISLISKMSPENHALNYKSIFRETLNRQEHV